MNANIQNFLWTANSKENLISDTPGYCVSKTKGYSCSCCENLTFLPVLPTQLQRGWQEWQCQQYMMGRELRICDALTPCPVLLLWVCLGYRYSSAHQGPCSLQIPRDLWELTSFPCPAEELGEIPYLQLRNFVNPTARQKHKHQHCQQQFLPARQSKVPRNVLSEVPVVPSSHQFCIYTVLPQFKTPLSTMKKMIIFCHWCNSALSIYLCQAGLVCARFHYGCLTVGA